MWVEELPLFGFRKHFCALGLLRPDLFPLLPLVSHGLGRCNSEPAIMVIRD